METQRGFERLVNFSDAVVAIAATLLILPLVDIAGPTEGMTTWELIAEHGAEIFAFVLSFVVIFRLWLTHHRIFSDLIGYTKTLAWANFVWLLSIVFLPFPTKLIAEKEGFDPSASSLYVGTIAVSVIAIFLIELVIEYNPDIAPYNSGRSLLGGSITAILMLVAFVLSFTVVGLWSLLALALESPVHRLIDRRRG
ncbi:TMEM175 family protein [Rhodococcoides yunnanense]|uniref:TMEM175 family protein n=1 Tax=Rhodococcoides yunnanense TaxID=278209 RepID=UPI000934EF6D|nr:TMEM175 family protein [Rhodococcus yunnanensis]